MTTVKTLAEKQADKLAALQTENELENLFTALTGITPSIISPERNPFATFHPKNKNEYLTILNALQPTNENFTLTFAGKADIQTYSPYSVHYGGLHNSPNYMDIDVKFKHEICPVWVDMPKDVKEYKFSVATKLGEHKGFGNYETKYTYSANESTSIQRYYGENKVMYAANEDEAERLKQIIFSN